MRKLMALVLAAWGGLALAGTAIAGTWRGQLNGEALVLELGANGAGKLDGDAMRYQLMGSMLMIEIDGEVNAYQIAVKGDVMEVSGGDLAQPLQLRRGGAAAAKSPAPGTKAPAASGSSPAAMAGTWCKVSSFSANQGGGSQSSQCFTLTADGRYTYQSERSMDAYSHQNAGMWGGTSSSSADSGRWSVNGGSLVAQSDSGAVNRYALEKRNHPRNRDPMICLDGDCYVTQYQKAPW